MTEKFSCLKKTIFTKSGRQSLADNLESRLSACTGNGDVLEPLSQLTSPKCLLEFSLKPDDSGEIRRLVDTLCDWYTGKPSKASAPSDSSTLDCCVLAAISRLLPRRRFAQGHKPCVGMFCQTGPGCVHSAHPN